MATDAQTIVTALRSLRPSLSLGGIRSDRDNTDPADNLAAVDETAATLFMVPAEYGGLWEGGLFGGWGDLIRAEIEIAAGDGPTGQNWGSTAIISREIFDRRNGLPERTRKELAHRLLQDGLRMVASNAETGVTGRVVARPVTGGIVLRGTKSFNTNSAGRGLANVGCVLEGSKSAQRHHVLVDLEDPKVEFHDDWDNMGQRGTSSQTITYHDVFVSDGWHYAAAAPHSLLFAATMALHAALMQGIGDGALDAMVDYVRSLKRGSLPQFKTAAEDPLILRRIGAHSSRLAAARALLQQTADQIGRVDEYGDVSAVTIDAFRAKVSCVEGALDVTAAVHEITGARSTSNKYRLDRFWRNARTFAAHDPTDSKNVYIGMYEVTEKLPPPSTFLRPGGL
jgi:alkylation response protein AidB-like acyl-CoA dehydrogenase